MKNPIQRPATGSRGVVWMPRTFGRGTRQRGHEAKQNFLDTIEYIFNNTEYLFERVYIMALPTFKKTISYITSGLGAIGIALQNYLALDLFIKTIIAGFTSITNFLSGLSQAIAIGLGGICSGMVNYFINLDLLDDFLKRFSSSQDDDEIESETQKLNGWRKFRYIAGILVFTLTGILFGATAFTIGLATPLSALAVGIGILVAIIMIIQEVETWLQSFENKHGQIEAKDIKVIFQVWKNSLTPGKVVGHVIAAGNVLALSLMFTLGLAEVLMVVFPITALPAFIIGVSFAFTFGAFTEFYFYNAFIAKFCQKFNEKWGAMKESKYALAGFFCVSANALVNGALTYTGVGLLTTLLVSAGIALPPVGIIIAICAISALFAAAASFTLGMDFWIRKMGKKEEDAQVILLGASAAHSHQHGLGSEPHYLYGATFKDAEESNNNLFSPALR